MRSSCGSAERFITIISGGDSSRERSWKGENWARLENYACALKLHKEGGRVPPSRDITYTVIGTKDQEVSLIPHSFGIMQTTQRKSNIPVLEQFRTYREPRKDIPFQRYCFNQRAQPLGESYYQYKTIHWTIPAHQLRERKNWHQDGEAEKFREHNWGSNQGPLVMQSSTLTTELSRHSC